MFSPPHSCNGGGRGRTEGGCGANLNFGSLLMRAEGATGLVRSGVAVCAVISLFAWIARAPDIEHGNSMCCVVLRAPGPVFCGLKIILFS